MSVTPLVSYSQVFDPNAIAMMDQSASVAIFPGYINPNIPNSRPYSVVETKVFFVSKPVVWAVGENVLKPTLDRIWNIGFFAYEQMKSAAIRFDKAFAFPMVEALFDYPMDPLMRLHLQLLSTAAENKKGPPEALLDVMAEVYPEDSGIASLDEQAKEIEEALTRNRANLARDPTNAELSQQIKREETQLARFKEIREAAIRRREGKTFRHAQET